MDAVDNFPAKLVDGRASENSTPLQAAVGLAYAQKVLDIELWRSGIEYEYRFWKNMFDTGGGRWKESFARRIAPTAPIDNRLDELIKHCDSRPVRILDVGAGPVTGLGTASHYSEVEIQAVDPLAPIYAELIAASGIQPRVKTRFAPVEALSEAVGREEFDIVHCRNALDHSINPLVGILNMLEVVRKNDGIIYLRHHSNEAVRERYSGFHQFNFHIVDGKFVIWNRSWSVDVAEWLAGLAEVEVWPGGLGAEVKIKAKLRAPLGLPVIQSRNVLEKVMEAVEIVSRRIAANIFRA